MFSLSKRAAVAVAVAALFSAPLAEARVTSITILGTTDAFVDPATGVPRSFGNVGSYVQVRGRVTGALDPFSRHNAVITDIELAPRDAEGKVTYAATFTMLRPKDISKASGVLVYGVSNRGGRRAGFGNTRPRAPKPARDRFCPKPR